MRRLIVTLPFVALVAACHKAPPPPEPMAGPIPAQICAEVKKSIDALSASGGIEMNDKGEATIEQAAWFEMNADQRDSLANALAFRAGCASGRQRKDQEVSIRSEDGTLLMHRFVSTSTDLQSTLQGGG
jgi:hypothetical protein